MSVQTVSPPASATTYAEPAALAAAPQLDSSVFERKEKKFLLTTDRAMEVVAEMGEHIAPDEIASSHVCSLYLDTPDRLLIRRSIGKPLYKEKIRLRSYGQADSPDHMVFVELKKKHKGIVYKRRVCCTAAEALSYLERGIYPPSCMHPLEPDGSEDRARAARNVQILHELDWVLGRYGKLAPSMAISCDRLYYHGVLDAGLRATVDTGIKWREDGLGPLPADGEHLLIGEDMAVLEIKFYGAMPIWLADLLSDDGVFAQSFSKYGKAWKESEFASHYCDYLDVHGG